VRAAVVERFGGPEVISVREVPTPVPGARDVLVRVVAAAVTSGDARIRGARFPKGFGPFARLVFGVRRPRRRILGSCFSGVVEAVGSGIEGLEPGDVVAGMTGAAMGAHAELLALPAAKAVRVPVGIRHEDAAGVLFGGTTALHFLRDKAHVGPGDEVLVNGASGAIGTNAVQLAAHLGAKVTAVTSGANAELVTALGAARVIDHTRQDVTASADRFDVVLDTVGNLSIATGRALLRPGGRLVLAVASLGETVRARGQVIAGPAPERVEHMAQLLELVAGGELTVVHDSTYPLDEIVEAYRRVDGGHKRGNIVVRP
jgi:NADPH:quinone reductase-like Zn-dependent oxidoreductase